MSTYGERGRQEGRQLQQLAQETRERLQAEGRLEEQEQRARRLGEQLSGGLGGQQTETTRRSRELRAAAQQSRERAGRASSEAAREYLLGSAAYYEERAERLERTLSYRRERRAQLRQARGE